MYLYLYTDLCVIFWVEIIKEMNLNKVQKFILTFKEFKLVWGELLVVLSRACFIVGTDDIITYSLMKAAHQWAEWYKSRDTNSYVIV